VRTAAAQQFVDLPPDDFRDLLLKMTNEELEDVKLYFKLGLLCFLWELTKETK